MERRAGLAERSALDSAGKRAAFAEYYAPVHFFTTRAIVQQLRPAPVQHLVDFGCGTGTASAAWALEADPRPTLLGIDESGWAVGETGRTWRARGLDGRAQRGDLVEGAGGGGAPPPRPRIDGLALRVERQRAPGAGPRAAAPHPRRPAPVRQPARHRAARPQRRTVVGRLVARARRHGRRVAARRGAAARAGPHPRRRRIPA